MAPKTKPYELFGSYILLKKLESDALGDLHRAMRIVNGAAGPIVALRRFTSGNREALIAAAETSQLVVSSLTGPSFVKHQQVDIVGPAVAIAHEYASGRSLRYIMDHARGVGASTPSPLPLDQAIVIAERVALSLATTSELRLSGERLVHGGLIPQFIWITDDGEIRVAGQQMGSGLAASLRDEKVAHDIGRYFAPETHHSGQASKSTEVYSLGAILYLLVTGQEPPDATRTSAFTHAVRASKTMAGSPMPDDIRTIVEKSLNIDPAGRYASAGDMHAALSALAASGKYSATSFNLAFYLSSLLKKEFEAEVAETERESAINVAAYLQSAPATSAPITAPAFAAAAAAADAAANRSKLPIAIAVTLILAAAGAGAWFFLGNKQQPAATTKIAAASALTPAVAAPVAKPIVLPEPIVASPESGSTAPGTASALTDTAAAEAAKKKLFDDAVKKRLQEEMLKLQAEYTRQLQREQARTAPVLSTAPPQTASVAEERRSIQAENRREAARVEEPMAAPAPVQQTATTLPPVVGTVAPQVATQTTAPAPAPIAVAIREGDVVDMTDLDRVPTAVREPRPVYPAIAARQRMEATIMASIFISETGEVLDVKILRGDPRFGFNDAAIRAFRGARYTPAMKDGKRVKTWVAQMIQFKP